MISEIRMYVVRLPSVDGHAVDALVAAVVQQRLLCSIFIGPEARVYNKIISF